MYHEDDEVLVCSSCCENFLFSAGEQKFFQSKKWAPPHRCRECRAKKKDRVMKNVLRELRLT